MQARLKLATAESGAMNQTELPLPASQPASLCVILFFPLLLISPRVLCKLLKSKSSPAHPACSIPGGKAHQALCCDPAALPSALLSIPPQAQGHALRPVVFPCFVLQTQVSLPTPSAPSFASPVSLHFLLCIIHQHPPRAGSHAFTATGDRHGGGAGGAVIWVSIGTDNPHSCQPVQMGRAVTEHVGGIATLPRGSNVCSRLLGATQIKM